MYIDFPSYHMEEDDMMESGLRRPTIVSINVFCIDSFCDFPDQDGDLCHTEISSLSGNNVVVTIPREQVKAIIKKQTDIYNTITTNIKST